MHAAFIYGHLDPTQNTACVCVQSSDHVYSIYSIFIIIIIIMIRESHFGYVCWSKIIIIMNGEAQQHLTDTNENKLNKMKMKKIRCCYKIYDCIFAYHIIALISLTKINGLLVYNMHCCYEWMNEWMWMRENCLLPNAKALLSLLCYRPS